MKALKSQNIVGMNMKGKGGSQNKCDGVSERSTKQTFSFTFAFFSLIFFHISILVLNGLLKRWWWWILWLNCCYYSYWRARGSIVWLWVKGVGREVSGWRCTVFFREIALLFKPIDPQTSFGIKILKQSLADMCLCFLSRRFAAAFFPFSCLDGDLDNDGK